MFALTTKYGTTSFKSLVKYYKFQIQCPHPSSIWYEDELVCERCLKALQQSSPDTDTWDNEGGRPEVLW